MGAILSPAPWSAKPYLAPGGQPRVPPCQVTVEYRVHRYPANTPRPGSQDNHAPVKIDIHPLPRLNPDYGQDSHIGRGSWVTVNDSYDGDLRAAAASMQLTGFHRPEDGSADEKALAKGQVRLCANNTDNEESNRNSGEAICITDGSLDDATANTATPEVQEFVILTRDMAMIDNIAYQPGRGNWVLHSDRDSVGMSESVYPFNNSIWICLEDGKDVDTLGDGPIHIANLKDLNAESTGASLMPLA